MSTTTPEGSQDLPLDPKKIAPKAAKKTAKKATKKVAKKAVKKKVATDTQKATLEKKQTVKKAKKKVSKKTTAVTASEPASPELITPSKPVKKAPEPIHQANERHSDPTPVQTRSDSPKPKETHNDSPSPSRNTPQKNNEKRDHSKRDHQHREGQNKNNRNNNRNNHNNNAGKGKFSGKKKSSNFRHREKKDNKPIELTGDPYPVSGVLELAPKGFGFLRVQSKDWEQSSTDVFVTPDVIRRNGLRHGVWIEGTSQEGPRGPQLVNIEVINGTSPEKASKFPHFDELKAVNPNKRISVETTSDKFTTRIIDIIAPIGRGQRGLIVSPPRSGKTTILTDLAEAIIENHEDTMKLIILLVDERPEEVTDFKRRFPDAEIFASSNDSGARNHCRMAELCIERAKRLVEAGEHVFLLMDSITRLARAYNYATNGSKNAKGKGFQSGGIVAGALEVPRQLFAAARNTRTAGSLTIIATALIQTNSRADEAIFQEFKGTGNMELVLDRRMAEQYLYPAVDIFKSGTRREELLLPDISLRKIHLIRRGLAGHKPEEAIERLLFFLKKFHNNPQMLLEIKG